MKRALLLVLTLACEPPCDTCGPSGTEIGDEGPAPCVTVEDAEVGSDLPVFGSTPEALAAGVEVGGSIHPVGPFRFVDQEPQTWEDDTPPPSGWADAICLDELWVAADWALSVPGIQVAGVGDLRFLEDGTALGSLDAPWHQGGMPEEPAEDESGEEQGTSGPSVELVVEPGFEPSFDLDTMSSVQLQVRGRFDGSWRIEWTWVGETYPEGDDGVVRAVEEPVWSGRL